MADPFLLFDNSKDGESFYFSSPVARIRAMAPSEVRTALDLAEAWRKKGFFVAGYMAYEAGWGFTFLQPKFLPEYPLIDFYVFAEKKPWDKNQESTASNAAFSNFKYSVPPEDYRDKCNLIQWHLRAGNTYQINYTQKLRFDSSADPWTTYQSLRHEQRVEYAAFFSLGEMKILSFSPELFLRKRGRRLESKPMKGTVARGGTAEEDRQRREFLSNDVKNRAENVMIVDLLRNDMARIAEMGTVKTPQLFNIEEYQTLYQMVSTVECEVDDEMELKAILESLFPCGSITGAPKLSSMQIIADTETEARGVYTGSVGYIEPNGDFCFNVAIRTVVKHGEKPYEMGIGGGILLDSDVSEEYREALLKSRFVLNANKNLQLVETMLFDGQKIVYQEEHLKRLAESAEFFGFEMSQTAAVEALTQYLVNFRKERRVRLCLGHDGRFQITSADISPTMDYPTVKVSETRINSKDVLQSHKTTLRDLYDSEYAEAAAQGLYDVLYFNEREELAEGSRHNVFLKMDQSWFTPPLSAGILPGIEREKTMRSLLASEKILTSKDLYRASEIVLTNSVRGAVTVYLKELQ